MGMREVVFKSLPILSPFGEFKVELIEPAARLSTVRDKVIGFLDANKPYGDTVINVIQSFLTEQGAKGFIREVKPIVTRTAPQDMIKRLTKGDAVVLSFADCGSCSTALAMDQVTIERKGIPTVAIVTHYFLGHYARILEGMGVPRSPAVIVDHPLGDGGTKQMAEEKAKKIVKNVVEALTVPVEDLREKYSIQKFAELRAEI